MAKSLYSSVLNCRGGGSNKQWWVGVPEKYLKMGEVIIKWPSGTIETIPWNGVWGVDNKMGGRGYDFYIPAFTGNGEVIHLYYFWNWCVFHKKKRLKVNRIPNGTFRSNALFWSKDLLIQHERNKLTLIYLNDSLCY